MPRPPWAAAVLKAGSLAPPPRTSMSSGTGAVPERLTSRAVSPRRRRASRVARPTAPVPKITCCGPAFMLSELLVLLGAGGRVCDHGALAANRTSQHGDPPDAPTGRSSHPAQLITARRPRWAGGAAGGARLGWRRVAGTARPRTGP